MDQTQENLRRIRALDYERDPDPENWRTISGAHVHVNNEGKIDGGAGGRFNGNGAVSRSLFGWGKQDKGIVGELETVTKYKKQQEEKDEAEAKARAEENKRIQEEVKRREKERRERERRYKKDPLARFKEQGSSEEQAVAREIEALARASGKGNTAAVEELLNQTRKEWLAAGRRTKKGKQIGERADLLHRLARAIRGEPEETIARF